MKLLFVFILNLIIFKSYADKAEIKIGVFKAKPFAYEKSGKAAGIATEFLQKMLGTDYEIKFQVLPYLRAIKVIDAGDVDLVIMYPNKLIDNHAKRSCLTLGNDNLLVSYSMVKDPKNKAIAVIRGANYGINLDEYTNQVGVVDYEQSIKLLQSKRVSSMFISSAAWEYYKGELKEENFKIKKLNFVQNMIYFKKDTSQKLIDNVCRLNLSILKKYPTKKFDEFLREL